MSDYESIILKISKDPKHEFVHNDDPKKYNLINLQEIPNDLSFFYKNFKKAILNKGTFTEIEIVNYNNLIITNEFLYPVDDVIWEELEEDISNSWYLIAMSETLSQYISIDLSKERKGFCYDSFIDTHANPGDSLIIARSFTELLKSLNESTDEWFWLKENFIGYGDAYD